MKIKSLTLSHFGKFHHTTISLQPGINVIHGPNESGKSTIDAFIQGMLFGIEKTEGRKGKESRYKKYLPWKTPTLYSGTMDFEMKGELYRISRNFYKETKEILVHNIATGRSKSIEPGERMPMLEGQNRVNIQNTISIGPLKLETDEAMAQEVRNYYTNLITSKNGTIQINKATTELKLKRRNLPLQDTIKAMHEVLAAIETEEQKIREREKFKDQVQPSENPERQVLVNKLEKWCQIRETIKDTIASYKTTREQIEGYERTLNNRNQLRIHRAAQYNSSFMNILTYGITSLACFFAVLARWEWMMVLLVLLFGILGFRIIYPRIEARGDVKIDEKKEERYRQYLFEQQKEQVQRLKEYMEQFSIRPYSKEIPAEQLIQHVDGIIEEVSQKLRVIEAEEEVKRNQVARRLHQLDKSIEHIEKLEERKQQLLTKKQKEEQEKKAIDLSIQIMEELARSIQDSFGAKVNQELSHFIERITDGEYDKLYVDDRMNLYAQNGEGKTPLHRLSTGILHQIYFTLRIMCSSYLFPEANLPLLLDETFVYYDNIRLSEVLTTLPKDRQILIFTHQEREMKALEQLNIPYYYIQV